MLLQLFTHSINAVMNPIKDRTGQSKYVDEYLGDGNSDQRKRASAYFVNMNGQVRNCTTVAKFNRLFCR